MKALRSQIISKSKLLAVAVLGAALLGYGGYRYALLYSQNALLGAELEKNEERLATTVRGLESNIAELADKLSRAEGENSALALALNAEQIKNASFEEQISGIASTVGILEKLSKTDPKLLEKYSKVYFLNEHYTPAALTDIDPTYVYNKDKPQQIHAKVWPYLRRLLEDAPDDGITLQIISAYRSFGTQTSLKSSYKVTYGAGTANQFSADQGYSEHQLGTAVDFTTPSIGVALSDFKSEAAYAWLTANAYRYGFVLSYPEENVYYRFEPWHWRFVGDDLARRLHAENEYFYDLDQREIDKYLISIFD